MNTLQGRQMCYNAWKVEDRVGMSKVYFESGGGSGRLKWLQYLGYYILLLALLLIPSNAFGKKNL